MRLIQLEETLDMIEKLKELLKRLDEDSKAYKEILELTGRAEKQRDELYRLDQKGDLLLEDLKRFLNS
jgi:hypothetical protein